MKYRTLKLCAYRHESGANVTVPSGQEIELAPKDAEALIELGAIEKLDAADAALVEAKPVATDGNLDGEQFAAWLAAGAGAREVVAWIGDSALRAEIAKVDVRPSVQKAIAALNAPVNPAIVEGVPTDTVVPVIPEGDDENAAGDDAGDEEE